MRCAPPAVPGAAEHAAGSSLGGRLQPPGERLIRVGRRAGDLEVAEHPGGTGSLDHPGDGSQVGLPEGAPDVVDGGPWVGVQELRGRRCDRCVVGCCCARAQVRLARCRSAARQSVNGVDAEVVRRGDRLEAGAAPAHGEHRGAPVGDPCRARGSDQAGSQGAAQMELGGDGLHGSPTGAGRPHQCVPFGGPCSHRLVVAQGRLLGCSRRGCFGPLTDLLHVSQSADVTQLLHGVDGHAHAATSAS